MGANRKPTLYWTLLIHEQWNLYLAATPNGLCYISGQNMPFEALVQWAERRYPGSLMVQDRDKLQPYAEELIEYFQGKRTGFTGSLDVRGTPFQLAVWDALGEIPFGHTRSYSDLSERLQKPAAVRAIGAAIGANPVLIVVPCHRVIGKDGSLTGYRGGLEMKTMLLELERKRAGQEGGMT